MRRVAIVGGGMAALAAALDLTREPGRHAVTVYQMGWRLGGKGASGRNATFSHRIEEHGLHLLGGYYENAFELIRGVYAEIGADWTAAFHPKATWTLPHRGEWGPRPWRFRGPSTRTRPGDGEEWPGLRDLIALLAGWEGADPRDEQFRHVIRLGLVHLRGALADELFTRGTGVIDHEDWQAWLRRHGAPDDLVNGPIVRGMYDVMFAWREGDDRHPSLSAGRILYAMLRFMFAARGALFWEMDGGMGDVVFAPIYQALCRRGVEFVFFHQLDDVGLGPTGRVDRLRFRRQAEVRGRYEPLVELDGTRVWPSEPVWSQLVDADAVRDVDFEAPGQPAQAPMVELRAGVDFDDVLLAMPPGAVGRVTPELAAASPRFAAMVGLPTVRTIAAQVWSAHPEPWAADVVCGLDPPWLAFADMSHLLPRERWSGQVRRLGYACGVTHEAAPDVRGLFLTWAARHRDWVVEDVGRLGPEHLYLRANVHPGDAYVLSTPDTLWLRPEPRQVEFGNLFVAGDWIRTGYDIGTLESATIGGRKAARAIGGGSRTFIGEGGGRGPARGPVLRLLGRVLGRAARRGRPDSVDGPRERS